LLLLPNTKRGEYFVPAVMVENLTHIGKLSCLFDDLISNLFGFYPLMAKGQEFFQLAW
jgi:hypothetical protein